MGFDDISAKKAFIIILITSLIIGLIGGIIGALLFEVPGPQGLQGETGIAGSDGAPGSTGATGTMGATGEPGATGPAGTQGVQGVAGANGNNSILQVAQTRNTTAQDTGNFTALQWFNMSVFDSSMAIPVNSRANSKLFVQFTATASLAPPGTLLVMVVVDNSLNSTASTVMVGPPSAGTFAFPPHVEFLTDSLASGVHNVRVAFLRETGAPIIMDRTLTVMEMAS